MSLCFSKGFNNPTENVMFSQVSVILFRGLPIIHWNLSTYYWHLVVITGDLFKLVDLRTYPAPRYWPLMVTTEAGGTHPTWMHSCYCCCRRRDEGDIRLRADEAVVRDAEERCVEVLRLLQERDRVRPEPRHLQVSESPKYCPRFNLLGYSHQVAPPLHVLG